MVINKFKFFSFSIFNTLLLFIASPLFVQAKSSANDKLKEVVVKQITEVIDVWISIAAATMILPIIAGGALMVLSGTNHKLATSGKSLVLGSGVTIALLGSVYVIVRIFLGIFGL
jgi:hypothetical protein